ncbi:MAG: DUF192 domain-containing protein [Candidatus Taylorbacteria bacterium]
MKIIFRIGIFFAACLVLLFSAQKAIDSHKVQPLDALIARSSQSFSTIASSTQAFIAGYASSTASTTVIKVPRGIIYVEIAQTEAQKSLGLSYRRGLATSSGMLFVFGEPTKPSFWMKDMNFPLDMVWIDSHKKIVSITKHISPDTYPQTFQPPAPVSFVLEIQAGDADRFKLATGTQLTF